MHPKDSDISEILSAVRPGDDTGYMITTWHGCSSVIYEMNSGVVLLPSFLGLARDTEHRDDRG